MTSATLGQLPWMGPRERAADTGLWCFIGVAGTLFSLFLVADVMRLAEPDATAIALPRQLWLSTAWLLCSSVLMGLCAGAARAGQGGRSLRLLVGAGAATVAFLATQGWAWRQLIDARVVLAGNPAASFFYVLTALHGLHVAGGLVALAIAWRALRHGVDHPRPTAWRLALCARYWHFLFFVWAVLLASMSWLTPDIARSICGQRQGF